MTDPSMDASPDLGATDDGVAATALTPSSVPDTPHGDVVAAQESAEDSPASRARLLPKDKPPAGVSLPYRVGLFMASQVGGLSSVCIKQLLLPIQVSQLDPRTTATSFALVASVGACAGFIASPLAGALSDRTKLRWGRRRPWIIGGIIVAVVGLLAMALASTIPVLLLGEVLAQIGVDTILATVTALIPDQVPEHERAGPAALNGMAPIVGGVLGLVLVTKLTSPSMVWQGYVLLAVLSAGFIGVFLLTVREQPVRPDEIAPFHWRTFLEGFFQPLAARDFTYTFASRTCVFLSFTLLGAYLFFYVSQGLHLPVAAAAQAVTTFQVLSTGALVICAWLAGMLAHRFQRLKPCLVTGALVMAGGILLLVLIPTWQVLFGTAILFGGGFGAVLGVDIALAIRVLPKATDRGKDLGLITTAIFLPLIVSPIIGAAVLNTMHSFAVLFLVAAASSVLGAGFIVPIRSVR